MDRQPMDRHEHDAQEHSQPRRLLPPRVYMMMIEDDVHNSRPCNAHNCAIARTIKRTFQSLNPNLVLDVTVTRMMCKVAAIDRTDRNSPPFKDEMVYYYTSFQPTMPGDVIETWIRRYDAAGGRNGVRQEPFGGFALVDSSLTPSERRS